MRELEAISRRTTHAKSSRISAGKSSLAGNGDTRELAYYPLQAVTRLFPGGAILPEDPQPSSPPSFYGHQSARYVDRPRFATLLVKSLPTELNPWDFDCERPRTHRHRTRNARVTVRPANNGQSWGRSSSSSSSSSTEIG